MPVIALRIKNMKSVVLYFTNLFLLQQILNYSRAATKGQEFIKRLSNITTQSTLFVPDNNGLYENQVISLFLYHSDIHFLYNTKITLFYFLSAG